MERREIVPVFLITIMFTIISLLIWGILSAMVIALVTFLLSRVIVNRLIFGKKYGDAITPFSCRILDSNMEVLAEFQQTDWQMPRKPTNLVEIEDATLKAITRNNPEELKGEKITINFSELYRESKDKFWKNLIPDNLTTIMTNLQGNFYSDVKQFFGFLPPRGKEILAKTIRAVIEYQISPKDPPKIWEIASLSAGIHMFWVAQSEPSVYMSYRTGKKFNKWKAMPWYGGFPVVKMWGEPIGGHLGAWTVEVTEGEMLPSIMCFPIEDEYIAKEKALNLARFGVVSDTFSTYAQNFMHMTPYITELKTMKTKNILLEKSWQSALNSLPEYEEIIGELSRLAFSETKKLQQLSGLIAENIELPENLRVMSEEFRKSAKEDEKKLTELSAIDRVKNLAKRPAEQKQVAPLPLLPAEKTSTEGD